MLLRAWWFLPAVTFAAAGCSSPSHFTLAQPHAIADENAKPGDPDWPIDSPSPSLSAFARPLSMQAGDRVDVAAAAIAPTDVTWSVYRLGDYGGAGARKILSGGPTAVAPQSDPYIDPDTGLVECRWSSSFNFTVGPDWLSGVYVARLAAADGSATFAPFIVKDARKADVILVMPTSTDAAYNDWGGESLYLDTRFNFPVGHAYEVSYDRPNSAGAGGGYMLTTAFPTARYLEANGYDVTYLANHDTGGDPSPLGRAKLVLSLGHDEYWSRDTRNHYDDARAAGVDLGFLGANTAYWQVRYDAAWDGMPTRRQIGYKEAEDVDPLRYVDDADVSGAFRGDVLDRPENGLLGVESVDWHVVDFPWVVKNPSHWLYRNMGMNDGQLLPALVGVETDAEVQNGATPPGIEVVAQSPTVGEEIWGMDRQQATVYETPAGGFVFAAGSIRFASTLQGDRAQVGAQRMVRNLIARAGGQPSLAENTLGAEDGFAPADLSRAASSVATLAGRADQPGFADGPAAAAQFSSPMGLALAPDGTLYVADSQNHRVRRVAPDGTVSTVAGSDTVGDNDGAGTLAQFETPVALALAPDGALYVADPQGHRVRAISPAGVVTTPIPDTAGVDGPTGLAVTPDGTLYIAEIFGDDVYRLAPGGNPVQVQLDPGTDGPLADPTGIFADSDGSLLLVDSGNRVLRRLEPATGKLTVIAGSSNGGFLDGTGDQARFGPMLGLARLGSSLLFADTGNYRVRRVELGADLPSTIVGTFAGSGQMSAADGAGGSAGLVAPTGIVVDSARNLVYVADTGHHTIRVLRP